MQNFVALFMDFQLDSKIAKVCFNVGSFLPKDARVNTHFHCLIFNSGSFLPKDVRVNLLDLVKSFQTSIHLQNLASIQPRTGLSKFAKN